jgi:uncharacterized protein (DUF1501 family)
MQKNLSTRRLFIQQGLSLLAASTTIPTFIDQTMAAIAQQADGSRVQQPTGKDGKILVVIQLSGGNDGLNTVVPYGDDAYYRARPAIGHDAKTVLKINNYIGLHPNLAPLKEIWDDGKMAIMQGVGYPNPNRSHFRSMDIWQSAEPDRDVADSGWLGRYFDNTCSGSDPHIGVAMGATLPLAMQGERVTPLSFDRPDSYRYTGRDQEHYLELNHKDGVEPAAAPSSQPAKPTIVRAKHEIEVTPASQLDFLHRTAMDAQVSSDDILRMTRTHQSPVAYPGNEFGQGLKTVAAMIQGGLPTRVYYVSLGGFDTHAGERGRHDNLMTQLAQGISAFYKDLKDQQNQDRVLMMTFSEFGRRVAQNASGGTDHGTAAPMFMIGSGLKQGLAGKYPSLTDLDQGDLKYNLDFRSVYATVLQNWMDTPSKPILGQQFPTLNNILKA